MCRPILFLCIDMPLIQNITAIVGQNLFYYSLLGPKLIPGLSPELINSMQDP